MRLLLFANDRVGSEIAQFLAKYHQDDLAMVVTIEENDISRNCRDAGIPTLVFESDSQVETCLQGSVIDLGVLAWWPLLIRERLIGFPRQGFVNTHPSLLPYNRGKHYNFWALVEEAPFGVSLHAVSAGVDSGDVLTQQVIEYDWTDNGETLYLKAQDAMVRLFSDAYPKLREGRLPRLPQNLDKGSFHRASELELASRIDLNAKYTGREILNLLRARTFKGYPGCWFEEGGQKFEARVDIRRKSK